MKILLAALVGGLAAGSNDLGSLRFLEGSWKGESGAMVFEERWTDAAGGTMLGVARTIASGKIVGFEFLRIEGREDGVYSRRPAQWKSSHRVPDDAGVGRRSGLREPAARPSEDHPLPPKRRRARRRDRGRRGKAAVSLRESKLALTTLGALASMMRFTAFL